MKIAIIGYGTMGKALAHAIEAKEGVIVSIIDPHSRDKQVSHTRLDAQALAECDVAIEFGVAQGVEERIEVYSQTKTPAVIATTGWYEQLGYLKQKYADASIIWSANFAIGVQLFYRIVRYASTLLNSFEEYDVLVHEWFHAKKADSPSGTAISLANILTEHLERKSKSETGRLDRRRAEDEIHVSSTRGGYSAGEHTVVFDSPADTISLKHASRSRDGYIAGALLAASWIADGRVGFYSLEEMLDEVLSS